jgi:hypothetical protein
MQSVILSGGQPYAARPPSHRTPWRHQEDTMIVIPLVAALLFGSPQQADVSQPHWTPEQLEQIRQKQEQIRQQREPARQRAIHINDLAGNIHSEADARGFVDAVAEELTGHRHMLWTARSIRHRVAHAEYEAATDPSRQIPEQRIVDVWNEYVREIDAPEEALVTVAELHNLRDSMYLGASRYAWKRELGQSIWTMPNIYALDAGGKVASGCRALEALKIIHDMHDRFQNVRYARERVQKGLLASEVLQQRPLNPAQPPRAMFSSGTLIAASISMRNPIQPAVRRYQQEHGERAYQQLLRRLFAELFPAD